MENRFSDRYFTKDLGEASAIFCSSVKFVGLEKEENFFWFVFQDSTQSKKVSDSYWSGELTLPAKAFYDAMRTLKDRLFARR